MRLPPYGKSIDQSKDCVWVWAGEKVRVHQSVRDLAYRKNEVAFYPPNEARDFIWCVRDREVIVHHFFEPRNFWVRQIVLACLKSGAPRVAEISNMGCAPWWNQRNDGWHQFFNKHHLTHFELPDPLIITHYSRS